MFRIFPLLTAILFTISLHAQTDTSYYSVAAKGKIKGGQKIWRTRSNEFHFTYQFNDRGRGDSVTGLITTDDKGLITSAHSSGVDYYKNPWDESFYRQGDSVYWVINGDKKAKKYNGDLYAPVNPPAAFELILKYVLSMPDKRVALLPEGHIRAEESGSYNISLKGSSQTLRLFSLYFEPSPQPVFVWMTNDLHFFALANSWSSEIAKSYESWADTLIVLQEKAGNGYYKREVEEHSKPASGHYFLEHATLFESATATIKKDMTVEIKNGLITAVFPSSSRKPSKADSIINCNGKFLMPGLWDMHGHFSKGTGSSYLAGGVTHLRDMGNDKILLTWKQQITENSLMGPDISYMSGFIDKEGPFQGPTGTIIASLDEGLKAIADFKHLGYQQIKLYSSIDPEWVKPLSNKAHQLGMKVCGHIPAYMNAEQAIKAGYDEITHMNFIMLNFLGDSIDTRTPARFRVVGDRGGTLDVNSKAMLSFIKLMKEKKVSLDPTMNVWKGMFNEFKGDTAAYLKPVINWLPESQRSEIANQNPFGSEEQKPAYKAAWANMLKMLKLMYDKGILLVAGTDGGLQLAVHHELEIYNEAGIPANQVLKIATWNAAQNSNLLKRFGSISPGKEADLILIDGNPAEHISDIRRIELVMKNKRMYEPKILYAAQGWSYYY